MEEVNAGPVWEVENATSAAEKVALHATETVNAAFVVAMATDRSNTSLN